MTWENILKVILLGIALAMDAFAVSITDGLVYRDINKKKIFFIAATFGVMQAVMPLIGYFVIELIAYLVGNSGSADAIKIFSSTVAWISFALLLFIGIKMLVEGIIEVRKPLEEKKSKLFSVKEVLIMGVATAIDALAAGVTMHAGLSTNNTVWLHVSIILVSSPGNRR